jgi:tetratricopeptide (TPR) repeat protein
MWRMLAAVAQDAALELEAAGQPDQALAMLDRAIRTLRVSGNPQGLSSLLGDRCRLLLEKGAMAGGKQAAEEWESLAASLSDLDNRLRAVSNQIAIAIMAGRPETAIQALLQKFESSLTGSQDARFSLKLDMYRAQLLLERGELQTAGQLLDDVEKKSRRHKCEDILAECLVNQV